MVALTAVYPYLRDGIIISTFGVNCAIHSSERKSALKPQGAGAFYA
jgi:hypothetical protein